MSLSSAIFDVDGVLLDSLKPHLQICEDKSKEYGLDLAIPGPQQFRELVRNGVKISPMKDFFEAVGFPPELAERAFQDYKKHFMRDYAPKPFPGVHEMLSRLSASGVKLGIVTSNVRENVDAALGESMQFFEPACIFDKDHAAGSKADALDAAARVFGIGVDQVTYVGDQPADWTAAREAGTGFLGVTYGWGISEADDAFPTVSSVSSIAPYVLASRGEREARKAG